jgi:hypothetical protein
VSQHGKSRFREAAIAALLSESSIGDAAIKSGVSKRTLLRWLKEPDFRRQYAEAKEQILKVATGILARNATKAAQTLEQIFAGEPAPHQGARTAAAIGTLRLALEAYALESFETRLYRLEHQSNDTETV